MNETSLAEPDSSDRYDGTDTFDENAFAIPGSPTLSGDACDALCSFFITLFNNSKIDDNDNNNNKNHYNNLLQVLRRNRDCITQFLRKFKLINAILKHITKATSKFFFRTWSCKRDNELLEQIDL